MAEKVTARSRMMNSPELAEEIGVPVQRLAVWRMEGTGPRYVKLGRSIRYRSSDVQAWLEANTVETTGGAA